MKLLFSILLLIISVRAHASLNFKYIETVDYSKPKLIDILEIQSELENQGYWAADLSHEQRLQKIGVDQLLFDTNARRTILLKFGMKPSTNDVVGKVIGVDGDYLFHGETAGKVPFALYFIGHSKREALNAVSSFSKTNKYSIWNLILPEARASASCNTALPLVAAGALGYAMSSPVVLQRLWNCGLTAAQGAVSSAKGIASSVKKFFSNPSEFWNSTKQAVVELKNFVLNIHTQVMSLAKSIGNLDFDTALQIGCTLAGELLPTAVLGIAGGVGIAKAAPMLALKLAKLKKMAISLRAVSSARRAQKLKNADRAVHQVVSCAL